jgi:hypothetical protein
MSNSKSDETKKRPAEDNKSKSGLAKNFPGFAQILQWEAEAKGITVEELGENMQRQSALTIRSHDEVMDVILEGVEWTEEEDIPTESQDGDSDNDESHEDQT